MIFIPGEVPSQKNSKSAFIDADNKQQVLSSKFCRKYIKDKQNYGVYFWREWTEMIEHKEYPLTVQFYFIRRTKGQFDYPNIVQVLLDLMKSWGWILDDDMDHVIPDFSRGYAVDKNKPGVEISIK